MMSQAVKTNTVQMDMYEALAADSGESPSS